MTTTGENFQAALAADTYGENFQAALAASIATDKELLDTGISPTQLMLAYGIISDDGIASAGSRKTACLLMGWKASGSFQLTQGVDPDKDLILSAWQKVGESYRGKDDPRSKAMLDRLNADLNALCKFFTR